MAEPFLGILQSTDTDVVPACLDAAAAAHDAPRATPEWFAWKFWGSPFGPAVVACAQAGDGRVAGIVAFGLYALTRGEQDVKAALSYETFVIPEFRGQGLFTRLMRLGMAECADRGVRMMFNFPNAASVHGFEKQGWTLDECLHNSIRPAGVWGCITRFDAGVRSAAFIPDAIGRLDPRDYEGFDECLAAMGCIRSSEVWAPVRTPEYMRWRYGMHPLYRYVVIRDDDGWAMVRTGRRARYSEAQILELFPSGGHSGRFLRAVCRRIGRRLGPDIISLALSEAHPAYQALRGAWFLPVPFRGNFTYYPLDAELKDEKRAWVITATEFHTY